MATASTDLGDSTVRVRYSEANNQVRIDVGDHVAIWLRDSDEGRALIDMLQDALTAQDGCQARLLLRVEDDVRAAADARESL